MSSKADAKTMTESLLNLFLIQANIVLLLVLSVLLRAVVKEKALIVLFAIAVALLLLPMLFRA